MDKPTAGICSDASYLIKSNILEYRVKDIETGNVLYSKTFDKFSSPYLTNVGEFFALIRAVKYVLDNNIDLPIYCDSFTAITWVAKKKVKSSIKEKEILSMIDAGCRYLEDIKKLPTIKKWRTDIWGEIPADYGRK